MICDELDAYLDRVLSDSRMQAFESHLSQCETCRQQLDAHFEFLQLVQQSRQEFDACFADRCKSFTKQRNQHSNLPQVALATLATAILLFIAVAIRWPSPTGSTMEHARDSNVLSQHSEAMAVESNVQTHSKLTSVDGDDFVAEPIVTQNPSFSIYWLHPTEGDDAPDSSLVPDESPTLLARSS